MSSPLVAGLVLATALSRHSVPAALVSQPIACAPNTDISSSGCGNTGAGNSGTGNSGTANSGSGNKGTANSGLLNNGVGNSGVGNSGVGNSGCGNNGVGNSGGGNSGAGNSGGFSCNGFTPPPTTVTPPTTIVVCCSPPTAPPPSEVVGLTLPVTGSSTSGPITLALGLMLGGAAVATMANRRRHALVAARGGELLSMSAAVGLLLTGRAGSAPSASPKD